MESKYKYMENWNERYPYLIKAINECVKNCSEIKYNIVLNNKCIIWWGKNKTSIQLDEEKSFNCKYLWVKGGDFKGDKHKASI